MLPFLRHSRSNAASADASFNSNSNRLIKSALMLLLPFVAILILAPFAAVQGQTLTIDLLKPPDNSNCFNKGATNVSLFYTGTGIAAGTMVQAQLSDSNGNFSPVNVIGTKKFGNPPVKGNTSGVPPANGYLIRLFAEISPGDTIFSTNTQAFGIVAPLISTYAGPNQALCGATSTTLAAAPLPAFATGAWLAQAGDGLGVFSDPTSPTSTFSGTAGITYSLRWQINNACKSRAFDNVQVTFNNGGNPPTLTLSGRNASGCGGGVITATTSGGTPPYEWTVAAPDSANYTHSATQYTVSKLPPGFYSVRVTDTARCTSVDTITLGQTAAPTVTYTKVFASTCHQDDGSISLTPAGAGPFTFRWTSDKGFSSTNQDLTGLVPADYTAIITDALKCGIALSDVTIKLANPLGVNVLTRTHPTTCLQSDGSLTLYRIGGVYDGITPIQFSLSGNGMSAGPQTSPLFTGLMAGTYTGTVIDSKGCTASNDNISLTCASTIAANNNSIEETQIDNSNAIRATTFPNPSNTDFTLTLGSTSKQPVEIKVIDLYGRSVYHTKGTAGQSYRFGHAFSAGVYVVQIIQGSKIMTVKVVKE
jgi:hypothetical protein